MDVTTAVAEVERRIAAACLAAGRARDEIRLVAVSKRHATAAMRQAYDAGVRCFGENIAQEAVAKHTELSADLPAARWSFLGHLQSNKAKQVAGWADEVQGVDSVKIAAALDRHAAEAGRTLDILLQVNTSAEPSKFGVPPEQAQTLAAELGRFERLRVRGLMTIAARGSDEVAGACFDRLVAVRDDLRARHPDVSDWADLSMGMSDDFELAIAHGATTVRVGRALFGERPATP